MLNEFSPKRPYITSVPASIRCHKIDSDYNEYVDEKKEEKNETKNIDLSQIIYHSLGNAFLDENQKEI